MSDHAPAAPAPESAENAAPKLPCFPRSSSADYRVGDRGGNVAFFHVCAFRGRCGRLGRSQLDQKSSGRHGRAWRRDGRDENKAIEFPLGDISATFVPPGADRNYRVEFRLFGTVKAKDLEHLEELYAERAMRFRHRLMLEVRNATMDELNENQLGLIQRRILATSIEILEEPILLGVGFQDYQVIEE